MELLCLLVGLLIPVVALGLVVRRAVRPLASASAYRNVAWKLGLDADTRGVSMQGRLDGRRLFVGEAPPAPGRRAPEVRGTVELASPLGLGLRARRRPDGRLRRLGRTAELKLGDPALDRALELRAFEPDRAAALFTPAVRGALRALLERVVDLEITDHWVRVRLSRPPPSAAALLALVDALRAAASALEDGRAALPTPDAMTPWLPAWGELAGALGLRLDPAWPRLVGDLDGRAVAVHAVRGEQGFLTDVRVGLLPHPRFGLTVLPADAGGPAASLGPHVDTGDADFDAAFVTKGYDPGALRARLGPTVRAGLLALAGRGRVRVDDVAVEVQDVDPDPAALRAVLEAGACVAADLGA